MSVIDIGLFGIIAVLFAERFWARTHERKMQDMMNRAMIARTVPEYEATAKSEITKAKLENENALEASKMLSQIAKEEERAIPIT